MSKPPEGAWFGRSPDHYATKGADCFHTAGGWYARCRKDSGAIRVCGPLSTLDAAMAAADRMLVEAKNAAFAAAVMLALAALGGGA